jgi:hypothetical protein
MEHTSDEVGSTHNLAKQIFKSLKIIAMRQRDTVINSNVVRKQIDTHRMFYMKASFATKHFVLFFNMISVNILVY